MKNKFKIIALSCTALLSAVALTGCQDNKPSEPTLPSVASTYEYNVFPKVQNVNYLEGGFDLSQQVNIVTKKEAKDFTVNRLVETLKETGFNGYRLSNAVVNGMVNIHLSVNGDGSQGEKINESNSNFNSSIYEKTDAYTLTVNNGVISILGEDEDALFYGVNTLADMLDEAKENKYVMRNVYINDYANTKYRGVIEGFYGVPWNTNERIEMIKYGSKYKMNSFVFAPKDDKYHSSKWRTLYPQAELVEMKKVVDASIENNVDFTWAIHPLMHDAVKFEETYTTDLEAVKTKLEQLYSIGVRHFTLSCDDIALPEDKGDKPTFYNNLAKNHARLANDILTWCESKEDKASLQIVPTSYFKNSENSKEYLNGLKETLNSNVEIYWTGNEIMGSVNNETINYFKENSGKAPIFWLNWPVNDYLDTNIFLGEATCLNNDVTELTGLVTNPMSQLEASKIGVFQCLDYAWNISGFDSKKSYRASFSSVEETYDEELFTFAQSLQTYEPGSFWVSPITSKESENFVPLLKPILDMTANAESFMKLTKDEVRAVIDPMYLELNKVIKAIDVYREAADNEKLVAEILPWMNSLRDLMIAGVRYMDTLNAFVRAGVPSKDSIIKRLTTAGQAVDASQNTYMVSVVDAWGSLYYASSGDLTLQPFFRELHKNIENIANTLA